jgi:MFS family permease
LAVSGCKTAHSGLARGLGWAFHAVTEKQTGISLATDPASRSILAAAPHRAPWAFAALFFLESVARGSLATVLPLNAYEVFGSKENVSLAYTLVACLALAMSFAVPLMIRRFSRRWSYTFGALCLVGAGFAVATGTAPGQLVAMFLRTFGAATLNITLSLYIMDHIQKQDLVRSEPLRFAVSTFAWMLAPMTGLLFYQQLGVWAAAIVPSIGALLLLSVFWYLRMSEKGVLVPGTVPTHNPLTSIIRFVRQPRLRLAWLIAFARSAYWVTCFIYIPILMLEGGLGPYAGGIAVSLGNGMLLNNLLASQWARRYSVRVMITVALAGGAALVAACGLAGVKQAFLAGALMTAAAFFISMLDGLGPIPFLRAVRAHERAPMTTVYRTYLDASELIPPFIYFLAFLIFGFSGAFYALSVILFITAWLSWVYLPRSL